jgi:hypothetical protein
MVMKIKTRVNDFGKHDEQRYGDMDRLQAGGGGLREA